VRALGPAAITQSSRTEVEAVVDRLTADLADAIERQTVTSEVLQAIGGSASEVQPVFETVIRHAVRLCAADAGTIYQLDGDVYEVAVALGGPPEGVARGLAVVMAVGFPVVEVYERLRHLGSGAPATAANAPVTPAATSVLTTPRRRPSSTIAAAARTANCHRSVRASASGIAAPTIAPIAAGRAPSRKLRTPALVRSWSKRSAPMRMNEKEGANATVAASSPPPSPAAA
jgi:hypothetical protein